MMRPLLLALSLLALLAVPARAQNAELRGLVHRVAEMWARGDAVEISTLLAEQGTAIDLEHGPLGPLTPRQVAAMLRELFADRETVAVESRVMQVVDGTTPVAFTEFVWSVRTRGSTEPERRTVFVGLVHDSTGWRITQIRLIR